MAKKKPQTDRLRSAVMGAGPRVLSFSTIVPKVTRPIDNWHIAVRGNIDVRQHHPSWYKAIGCLDDKELASSLGSLSSFSMPGFSIPGFPVPVAQVGAMNFNAGDFLIDVIPDRWMIQTENDQKCQRIIEVATKVFSKLSEIVITAYGIHQTINLEIKGTSAAQFLADQLGGSKLALRKGSADASISYFEHLGDGTDTQIWFNQSSVKAKWLSVGYNRHHPILNTTAPLEYFDLGEKLVENAIVDWNVASDYGANLAKLIAEGETDGV